MINWLSILGGMIDCVLNFGRCFHVLVSMSHQGQWDGCNSSCTSVELRDGGNIYTEMYGDDERINKETNCKNQSKEQSN